MSFISVISPAQALNPASNKDRSRISDLIDDGNSQQYQLGQILEKLQQENKYLAIDISNKMDGDVEADKQLIQDYSRQVRDLTRERDLDYDKAIHLTLTAYGIVSAASDGLPQMPVSEGQMPGAYDGKEITWLATARDVGDRFGTGAHGETTHIGDPGSGTFALTGVDGVTTIFPSEFDKSDYMTPEFLALILAHEYVHYRQFTTENQGSAMSYAQREKEAWEATKEYLWKLGFSDQERTRLLKDLVDPQIRFFTNQVEKERLLKKWTFGLWTPSQGRAEAQAHDSDDLYKIEERFDDISQAMALELERARAQANQEKDERTVSQYREFAIRFCANQGEKTMIDFFELPKPRNADVLIRADPSGPRIEAGGCAFNAYEIIASYVSQSTPLDWKTLIARTIPAEPVAAPPAPAQAQPAPEEQPQPQPNPQPAPQPAPQPRPYPHPEPPPAPQPVPQPDPPENCGFGDGTAFCG